MQWKELRTLSIFFKNCVNKWMISCYTLQACNQLILFDWNFIIGLKLPLFSQKIFTYTKINYNWKQPLWCFKPLFSVVQSMFNVQKTQLFYFWNCSLQSTNFTSKWNFSQLHILDYKLFYALCCYFFWISTSFIFVLNIFSKANLSRCVARIIGAHFCPWCHQFHVFLFLFLIRHGIFWAWCLWHRVFSSSFDSVILPFRHVAESSSSTLLLIILASISWSISLL